MVHIGVGIVHALQKMLGFERIREKSNISVKLKIISSVHSFEDPAQVMRTYPSPR
jgi:hypothetical protein